MKKIISIVLLLAMALCLCACGEDNKEARYIGAWKYDDNKGNSATLTMNVDGTAKFVLVGENAATYNFIWVAESVSNIVLKWDGTPVTATSDTQAEDATEDTTVPAVPTTSKKDDPSIVGFGSLKVINGELWLMFSEGSSKDVLLFTYGLEKVA